MKLPLTSHLLRTLTLALALSAVVTKSGGVTLNVNTFSIAPARIFNMGNNTLIVHVSFTLGGTVNIAGGIVSSECTIDATTGGILNYSPIGGFLTRPTPGIISYLGDLAHLNPNVVLQLDADKTFAVSGNFDISNGVSFELTGLALPSPAGPGATTGSIPLGTDGFITGAFAPATTSLLGLGNAIGDTFISEVAGEGAAFNPLTQSVYWVQENAGDVSLHYSLAPVAAPEPGSATFILTGGLGLLARRRRACA